MNNDIIHTNSNIELRQMPKLHGLIDAHAYHSSRVTWPLELMYVQIDGEPLSLKDVASDEFPCHNLGMFTVEQCNHLVDINTEMYNRHKGTIDDLDREDIPSLIISSTKDMEFAHIDGYEGKAILFAIPSVFQGWKTQIRDTEMAVARNPLRLFPLFSYDPRRYRLPDEKSTVDNKGCETWDKPFARIVGCKDSVNGMKKNWLGFCMNPSFGFRPFDEFCEHLPKFYKKCMDDNIPILANCAPVGVTAREANRYKVFDAGKTGERIKQSGSRKLPNSQNALCSSMYGGRESVIEDVNLDYFYRNYGHPRNWIPVLKSFPELRLCLSGFGGSREWQHLAMQAWATKDDNDDQLPYREWIRCIIKLTRYKNVYADISGLDISNPSVWSALREMLDWIQIGNAEFEHLKYKLIFGSGWYLSHLMDMNTTYSNYCRNFKELFDEVDKSGKFWERVSLINPWNFYALSSDKINEIHDELEKSACEGRDVNSDLQGKMVDVFNGSDEGEGLVKYISGCNDKDPIGELKVPEEGDEDLAADEVQPEKSELPCTEECKHRNQAPKTDIHNQFGCYHYGKIRELVERNGKLSDNNEIDLKGLFNLMESGMRVRCIEYYTEEGISEADRIHFSEMSLDMQNEYRAYFKTGSGELVKKKVPKFRLHTIGKLEASVNIEADEKGEFGMIPKYEMDNGIRVYRGPNFVRLANPYQATFHELWHNIDCLAGEKRTNLSQVVWKPFSNSFIDQLYVSFKEDIDGKPEKSVFKIYYEIRDRSAKGTPVTALYYLCDIIEGISHCYFHFSRPEYRFKSPFAPRPENYWSRSELAAEYFAAMGCIITVGDTRALDLMKEYLPKSYLIYKQIIESAIPIAQRRSENGFVDIL